MSNEQRRYVSAKMIFFICWVTYVTAYLCRVNFSSALSKLEAALSANASSLGIAGSLFFITYACGQLVNGYIGDRISPYKFITTAMFATALLNMLITLTANYYIIMLLWGLNGYFQSMLWGPLMRILSMHFDRKYNVNISTGMSTSMVIGFGLSWTVFGRAFMNYSWQIYFLLPAAAALISGLIWVKLTGIEAANAVPHIKSEVRTEKLLPIILKEKLWLTALICVCLGLIKESFSLWTPILLTRVFNIGLESSFAIILIIPAANFAGILLSRQLAKKFEHSIYITLLMMIGTGVACSAALLLLDGQSAFISVFLIAVISGMMYGCNNILLSYIPLSFAHKNIVSTLVGIFDFSAYAGAAVSSIALGILLTNSNYRLIFVIWSAVAAAAAVLSGLYGFFTRLKFVK